MVLDNPSKKHIKNGIYYIPSNITEIGENAFIKSQDFTFELKGIVFPEGLKRIGNSAFFDCLSDIKEIILPSSLEEIGECAFWALDNLERVIINSKIKKIGNQAFCNCTKAVIYFSDKKYFTPELWHPEWIGNCKGIEY